MESYATWIGLAGVALVGATYALFTLGRIASDDWRYPLLNIVGTGGILYSLLYAWNLPSFVMQVVWIVLSAIGLLRVLLKGRHHG